MSIHHKPTSIRDIRLRETGITPPDDWSDVEQVRRVKLAEIGAACTAAIYAGIEVDGKRYSLTEHDQFEMSMQAAALREGAAAVPYHADGELCRLYAAEEFAVISQAAMAHIFYHRTYVNHLNAWLRRAQSLDEMLNIHYGSELPADLAVSMMTLLSEAGGSETIT